MKKDGQTIIGMAISNDVYEQLKQKTKNSDLRVSQYVRRLILDDLKKEKPQETTANATDANTQTQNTATV